MTFTTCPFGRSGYVPVASGRPCNVHPEDIPETKAEVVVVGGEVTVG
ncbi:hypothetical protein OG302_37995 [Streptomyces sp. NBC_01283]|nr:hypothetical protein OG302_37995 [Streptomyces sp. NBC_01283]